MTRTSLLLALLAGCGKDYTTPDEACTERVRGDATDSRGLFEAVGRVNCYRRFVGLDEVGTDARIQAATEAHLEYVIVNESLDDTEEADRPGFTGEDTWERLAEQGLEPVSVGAWPFSFEADAEATPTDIIDVFVADPWLRQVVLQPGAAAVGFGLDLGYGHFLQLYSWPTAEATRFPAVYPADGQVGVPLEIFVPMSIDIDFGLPEGRPIGYPITVTVGSFSGAFDDENPYDLTASGVTLVGPDGELAVNTLTPGMGDQPLAFGIIVAADEPLQPSTTYTFSATLDWIDGSADVESTFTTAAE